MAKIPRPKQANATKARQRKVAKLMVDGLSQSEAMRQAGYGETVITQRSGHTMQGIRDEFLRLLNKLLPPAKIMAKLLEGLEATHAVVVMDGRGMSHAEMIPDYHARVKYLQLAAQMGGLIVRREEGTVKHEVSIAEIIAARRRVETCSTGEPKQLPDTTTVTASVVTGCDASNESALKANELGSSTLGETPNGQREGEDKA